MAVGDIWHSTQEKKQKALEESGGDVEHLETISRTPTRTQQVQRHFRRFWIIYGVAGIIFSAIFLPILFIYIIPAIAQDIVSGLTLPVYSAQIVQPAPDRVTFSLDTQLALPKGIKATTDPLNLALFHRDDKPMNPYLSVHIPTQSLNGPTNVSVTNPHTKVLDENGFVEALNEAVYSKRFYLSGKGSGMGHLGKLKAWLTLDKDVWLDGLDKLSGFAIESAQLLIPAESDGTNLKGKANLPNHSVVTFALGNVTLNIKSQDLVIGYADIQNVVLKPGDNFVDLSGRLDLPTVIDNLGEVLAAQGDALTEGKIELSASGNKTMYNGQHIPYFERVLNNLTLTTRVPIMKVLKGTIDGLKGRNISGILDSGVLGNDNSGGLGNLGNLTEILGNL